MLGRADGSVQPSAGQFVGEPQLFVGLAGFGRVGGGSQARRSEAKCPAGAGKEAEMHMSLRLNVIATALSFAFLTAIVLGLI